MIKIGLIYLPILIAVVSIIKAFFFKNKRFSNGLITITVSLYATLIGLNISQFQENQVKQLENIRSLINISDLEIELLENEINGEDAITNRILDFIENEQGRNPKIERYLSAPGQALGKSDGYDCVFGRAFFSFAMPITYYVGFHWTNNISGQHEQFRQRQMLRYLYNILGYSEWDNYRKNPILRKKAVFHVPHDTRHDYWYVSSDRVLSAGVSFLAGEWAGYTNYPVRKTMLLIDKPNIATAIKNEFIDLFTEAISHLEEELKKEPYNRCVCTIFLGDRIEEGLQPTSISEIQEKMKVLEALFLHENGNAVDLPYLIKELRLLVNDYSSR